MNFFAKKNQNIEKKELEIEPIKLYGSLLKNKEFTYLRGIQEEVLNEWHKRRDEKDLIIKMNTGAGKTLTGLLILYSKMIESKKPVVYLCPDNQLFRQVIDQSKNFSIPTCVIEGSDFPEEFLNSESVLVSTIQRMFNGKNIFDRDKIKLEAVLIDDAHKCVQRVIESFTVKIASSHDLYKQLKNLFKNDLKEQSLGAYEAMSAGESEYYMKVPYWNWMDKEEDVVSLFTKFIGDRETLLFKYDLILNNLAQYEMHIDSEKIEISPIVAYVKNIIAYDTANHHYALSATFVNDFSFIKDLDFSFQSINNPITPINRKDYGQRLILTPQRYFSTLSNKQHLEIINHHQKNNENVVILVASERRAKEWSKVGAIVADNENLEETIDILKSSKGNIVVFVNRYDGIDLSGDSCNVLVLHDYPRYKFIKDKYFQNIHHETSANTVAQTIEQGMGRSVRSSSDYSVVYLMGRYNLSFLRRKVNLEFFNEHTRKQLEMGLSLLDGQELNDTNAVSTITDIADYCLNQDDEWKKFYTSFMDNDIETPSINKETSLQKNLYEKEAVHHFIREDFREAIDSIENLIALGLSDIERSWYYQMQAHFAYRMNKNSSNDFQQKARTLSIKMYQPFLGKTKYKHQFSDNQFVKIFNLITSFSTNNDLIIHINEIISDLKYEPSKLADDFECALFKLGELLGFDSSRPEKSNKEGCDVLWVSENVSFILEAKSRKLPENKISKSDIEQLYHSLEWFNDRYIYKGIVVGVTLQPNHRKNDDVTVTTQIKVLSQISLDTIIGSLNELKIFFRNNEIGRLSEDDIKTEFERLEFKCNQFENKYLKNIN